MKTRSFIVVLLINLFSAAAFPQTFNKPKMDSLFDILAAKDQAMGSLVLSKDSKVVYSRAIGYASIQAGEKTPATEKTKYRVGSITKMFTATMIFQLIDAGKLSLTTTLNKYYPGMPNADKITVSNMLNHRSGLHNFTDDPDYIKWMTEPKTHEEIVAIMSKYPVDFQPGEKYSYSNTNYVLLGYIIEKISKKSYDTYLQEKITSKIGLADTHAGGQTDLKKNESFSYLFNGKEWVQMPVTDLSVPGGAGAVVSTPADLDKFIEALFALKLVSDKSLTQMKTITDGYGMGMFQIPFGEKKLTGTMAASTDFIPTWLSFPKTPWPLPIAPTVRSIR
jgi:D-alanyl-D-alanine carboxypeptidase